MGVEGPICRSMGACSLGSGHDVAVRSGPEVASKRAAPSTIFGAASSDPSPSRRSRGASGPNLVVTLGELVEAIASVTANVSEQAAAVNHMLPANTVKRVGLVE